MRPRTASAGLLLTLTLAGCGGSGAGTGSTTSSTTSAGTGSPTAARAGYIAKANALCAAANVRQEALHKKSTGLATNQLPPVLHQQAAIAAALTTSLGKLAPPAGDRSTVARFVNSVHELAVYSTAVANSIAAGHTYAARALAAKLVAARQRETLLGQGYGFAGTSKTCASGKGY